MRHLEWVRAVALGMVRHESEADDIVQETYARALRSPPRRGTVVPAWLVTVLRNVSRERYRKDSARERREAGTVGPVPLPTAAEALLLAERQRVVADAVRDLDAPFHHTVVLRFFHGASFAAIAAAQEVSEATARSRLHRALKQLRGDLQGRFRDRGEEWLAVLFPLAGLPSPDQYVPPPSATGPSTGLRMWPAVLVGAALLALLAGGVVWWGAGDAGDARDGDSSAGVPAPSESTRASDPGRSGREGARVDRGLDAEPETAQDETGPDGTGASTEGRRMLSLDILGGPEVFEPPARLELTQLSSSNAVSSLDLPVLTIAVTDPGAPIDLGDVAGLSGDLAALDVQLFARSYLPAQAHAIPSTTGDPGFPARFVLVPAAGIEGRVVLPDGTPAVGATVTCGSDGDHEDYAQGTVHDATVAGADGAFRLEAPEHANVRLAASLAGHQASSRSLRTGDAGGVTPSEIRLREGLTVSGGITAPHGAALAGQELSASLVRVLGTVYTAHALRVGCVVERDETLTWRARARFSADGEFVVTGLSSREYRLTVGVPSEVAAGGADVVEPITALVIPPIADLKLDARRVGVRVEVSDPSGAVAGAHVSARSRPDDVFCGGVTGSDGVIVLGLRPEWDYDIDVDVPPGRGERRRISTQAHGALLEPMRFELVAAPTFDWSVRLNAPGGGPVRRAGVEVLALDDPDARPRYRDVVAADDGALHVPGLAPGLYRITVRPGAGVADVREGWLDEVFETRLPSTSAPEPRTVTAGGRLRLLVEDAVGAVVRADVMLFRGSRLVQIAAQAPTRYGPCQIARHTNGGTVTRLDGPTEIVPALAEGEYEMRFTPHGDHRPTTRTITIRAGELTVERIQLEQR